MKLKMPSRRLDRALISPQTADRLATFRGSTPAPKGAALSPRGERHPSYAIGQKAARAPRRAALLETSNFIPAQSAD